MSMLLLAVATMGLWIFDYTGKNVQMLEDTVVLAVAVLLGLYTYFKLYKLYSIMHIIVAIAVLLLSLPYFLWSIFNFSMYSFNGARLPLYCYVLLFPILYILFWRLGIRLYP